MALNIDLTGKVVLVTGVTAGIGKAVAANFAQAGAHVAGCALEEECKDLYALSSAYGVITFYQPCDVTKDEDLQSMVQATIDQLGGIDIVVSNAGSNIFEGAENCSNTQWQHNQLLNLQSHWKLAQFCKPYLQKSGEGVIILMSSNHAFSTIPGCFPYNVAKTALTGLVRSLAIEWGPDIRTVGIAPGFIDTPGNQQWFNAFPDAAAERHRVINLHPVKRIGSPEEVGAWCVFLASKYASFASGVTYLLDGGRSALMQDS